MNVLGLFPAVSRIGGVERAGYAAWQAISAADPGSSHLVCFRGGAPPGASGNVYETGGKASAIWHTMRREWPVAYVLVWHVGLLKLLPFVRPRPKRVVLFLHGIEAWRRLDLFTRRILRGVDLFLSNSEFTWRRFISFNPEFQWFAHRVVPLGVDIPARAMPPPAGALRALMLGRTARSEAYKGHVETIAAWKYVLAALPTAELHIAGPGDMREILRDTARTHGVESAVHLHGPVSEEKKEELIVGSRCLALPSKGEGFGLVYLEAMRLGRPCLVSDCDAGREVVNPPEAGLSASPNDEARMSAALCRLLTAGAEWDTWSLNSRRRYEAHFTEARFRERLLAAIGETL